MSGVASIPIHVEQGTLGIPSVNIDALRTAGLQCCQPAWAQYVRLMRSAGIDLCCDLVVEPTQGIAWVPRYPS
jgi:hypothetical protein